LCLDARIAIEAGNVRIPALIVQPLVENAIRHGLSPAAQEARVVVIASVSGGRLKLEVSDPARGGDASNGEREEGEGFGLRYVRERLAHFYGTDASVGLVRNGAGTVVTLEIPRMARDLATRT
ncbi:MAG: hypothetical protein M3Y30_03165, partial [Gemmatimonadota bacterium]|nr:hypothetical protein [Gemmatimonadota bacterium]